MIFGARVEQAREFRGLTQRHLAELIGVSQVAVARIESGSLRPSDETVGILSRELQFPPAFFERETPGHFAVGTLEFRAPASISARAKKQAHQFASIVFEVAVTLAQKLRVPQLVLPSRLASDPELAAKMLRSVLGISPNAPIRSVIGSMERAGVFVFGLPDFIVGCDGFSNRAVNDNTLIPVVCVSTVIPADRARFTVAHEIGELTLTDMAPGRERERKAHKFASAFLLPPEAMHRDLIPPLTLADFVRIKKQYGVAVQAAIVRAYQLGIITERRYHTLFRMVGARGMRRNEGFDLPPERPRALRKMAELLYGDPIDFKRLASDMRLDPWLAKQIFGVHAPRPMGALSNHAVTSAEIISLNDRFRRPLSGSGALDEARAEEG